MPTNAYVTITYDPQAREPVTVDPTNATIEGAGTATWTIQSQGCEVTIEFAGRACPFPPGADGSEGLYESAGPPVTTAAAAPDTNGDWKYTVTVHAGGKGGDTSTDGVIVIGNNP